jgi:hypothetical protein
MVRSHLLEYRKLVLERRGYNVVTLRRLVSTSMKKKHSVNLTRKLDWENYKSASDDEDPLKRAAAGFCNSSPILKTTM